MTTGGMALTELMKVLGEKFPQCLFVRHKSHLDCSWYRVRAPYLRPD